MMKKKRSFFNLKKADETPPPVPPKPAQYSVPYSSATVPKRDEDGTVKLHEAVDDTPETQSLRPEKSKGRGKMLDKKKSFAMLRSKSSRFLRLSTSPSPGSPTSPKTTTTPPRPHSRLHTSWSSTSSTPLSSTPPYPRPLSISRPTLVSQSSTADSIPPLPSTVPFTKPPGAPPERPPRPSSLDTDLLDLMKTASTRLVLPSSNRRSSRSTNTSSSTKHTRDSQLRRASIEARLGLPSGRASQAGRPRGLTNLSARGVRAVESSGREREQRDASPIEQYVEGTEEWSMERRVEGRGGADRGVLWKDGGGGWHFVQDI